MADTRRGFFRALTAAGAIAIPNVGAVEAAGGEVNVDLERSRKAALASPWETGTLSDFMEARSSSLYDSLFVEAGRTLPERNAFFGAPIGSCSPGSFNYRSCLETNMQRSNQLPPPNAHTVESILISFPESTSDADRMMFSGMTWFELILSNKIVARAPLFRAAAVGELSDLMEPDRRGRPYLTHRRKDVDLRSLPFCLQLKKPVQIAPMQQFEFWMFSRSEFTPVADFRVYVFLDGEGLFGVQ